MAMKCNDCGGIIPDIMFNGDSRCDCKNHIPLELNIEFDKKIKCVFSEKGVIE